MTLFLCGDVMTGRGVDQILPHPSGHQIFEAHVSDARDYVALAEARNGPISRPATGAYIWGDALSELARVAPDVRIINLETSVTAHDEHWSGKGINYRMHPENISSLTAVRLDVCGLANNHVLDYGYAGLTDTLETLTGAGLKTAGAGGTLADAQRPAIVSLAGGRRVLVFAFGTETSGIPPEWAAHHDKPGIDLMTDLSEVTVRRFLERVDHVRGPRDLVVASIHWGGNWGYDVPRAHVRFARWLIEGGVDLVHGHSSHHPLPIEVYRDGLILYGCGDFINDYEGIEGFAQYRGDLVLMYFATLSAGTGRLTALHMTPMQIKKMTLNKPSHADAVWLRDALERVSASYGTHVELATDGTMFLRWRDAARPPAPMAQEHAG